MSKKFFVIIFSAIFTLAFALPASASPLQDASYKLLKHNDEIKDQKELIRRAVNKISDIPFDNPVIKERVVSDDREKSLFVTKYKTAQLLSEKQDLVSGDLISTYAVTTIAAYDASRTETQWDPQTSSVQAYATIYVSYVYDQNGLKYWKLLDVTGGWGVYASGVSVTNKQVIYGVTGIPVGGGLYQNSITQNPTASTFSYTAPTSWPAVLSTGASIGKPYVGTSTSATISAFGSTWTLTLTNYFA